MKQFFLFLIAAGVLGAQVFPDRIATDQDLFTANDNATTTLAGPISGTDTTISVAAPNPFSSYNVLTVDDEQIEICSSAGTTLTVCPGGRGFAGTNATSHNLGAAITNYVSAVYHNTMSKEVQAIENWLFPLFPLQISNGGTGATTPTGATHNLQFILNNGNPTSPIDGAVARSDDSKMGEHVSVLDFNADPTGVADSSSAFTKALAVANVRPGVKVEVPCGTYSFSSTINISKVGMSFLGENKACVTLRYTGTTVGIQHVIAPDIPAAGEVGNFVLQMPNATSSTVGIWSHTQVAYYHNILVNSCSAGTGILINNGLTTNQPAPLNVSYNENNVFVDVRTDHCAKGFVLANNGATPVPDYMFMGYNKFLSIFAAVGLGQVGFEVQNGPLLFSSEIDLTCAMDNFTGSGDAACVKSSGYWSRNMSVITGEYNGGGDHVGNPYSVWVTSTGSFDNVSSSINVNTLNSGDPPASFVGDPIPFRDDRSSPQALLPFSFIRGTTQLKTDVSPQPTCTAAHRGLMWFVAGATGVADQFQVCEKNASDVYVWTQH